MTRALNRGAHQVHSDDTGHVVCYYGCYRQSSEYTPMPVPAVEGSMSLPSSPGTAPVQLLSSVQQQHNVPILALTARAMLALHARTLPQNLLPPFQDCFTRLPGVKDSVLQIAHFSSMLIKAAAANGLDGSRELFAYHAPAASSWLHLGSGPIHNPC